MISGLSRVLAQFTLFSVYFSFFFLGLFEPREVAKPRSTTQQRVIAAI